MTEIDSDGGRAGDKGCVNKKRACAKMAVVVLGIVLVLAVAAALIDRPMLDEIKHTLSLRTIVALVIIINLVSGVCLLGLYAAYRWVRRDLKPRRDDDLDL